MYLNHPYIVVVYCPYLSWILVHCVQIWLTDATVAWFLSVCEGDWDWLVLGLTLYIHMGMGGPSIIFL